MKTAEFNKNYEICRKSKGIKAMPKRAPNTELEIVTADGTPFDTNTTYYFFDEQTQAVRQSTGLRRENDFLSVFGLKIVAVSKLQTNRDAALSDGQQFFKSQIENLQKRVADFELEKSGEARSLKSFLMAKE